MLSSLVVCPAGWAERSDAHRSDRDPSFRTPVTGLTPLGPSYDTKLSAAIGTPFAGGFDERRDLAGEFVIDGIFVAADACGIRVRGVDHGQRLAQCCEIAGELQPAIPHPLRRARQHAACRYIGLRQTVEIRGDLDRDRALGARLVTCDLDPKRLVAHLLTLARGGLSRNQKKRAAPSGAAQ